jgi:hypothetical protein
MVGGAVPRQPQQSQLPQPIGSTARAHIDQGSEQFRVQIRGDADLDA